VSSIDDYGGQKVILFTIMSSIEDKRFFALSSMKILDNKSMAIMSKGLKDISLHFRRADKLKI
jgi:hypothetical protein